MTASKPRVLCVGAFPPPETRIFGGILTSCRILMASSFSRRLDLDLIDSTQISNPPPGLFVRLLLAARRFLVFVWRFERRRPEAVLLFTAIGSSVVEKGAMAWYARLRGGRAYIFPRGGGLLRLYSERGYVPAWIRIAFHPADKILCQGPAWRAFVTEGLGKPDEAAPVIPNWTATPELLAIGEKRVEASGSGPVRLLFVGWVERDKGVLDLLEAVAGLTTKDWVLDIVGHGHAFEEASRLVEARGLKERVRFSGWTAGEALERKFAEADVFVLPSWEEGLPNAMIEAMAAGVCPVVTPVGTIPDVIRDGENGLIAPVRNPDRLREILAGAISDPTLRHRLARAGHEDVRRMFSVEPAVEALLQALRVKR